MFANWNWPPEQDGLVPVQSEFGKETYKFFCEKRSWICSEESAFFSTLGEKLF